MTPTVNIEDSPSLIAYLRSIDRVNSDELPEIRVLAGGVSNRTVWVRLPSGETWVLKQALDKLRVAVDWFSSPERIHREAAGMRALNQLAPGRVPRLIFEDAKLHLLAMEAVPEPHDNWKALLLAGQIEDDHVRQFGELLGTIHRSAYECSADLAPKFDDRSFFESLRLEPYYAYTASQVPESADFYKHLISDTRARRLTLVHGDYSPKNILVRSNRLILLDHEVIHFGDPAFDVGFSLAHFFSKAHCYGERRQSFAATAALYWQSYRSTLGELPWGEDLEPRSVRHALGCLLARACGRSPLDYLSADLRARQRGAVVALMPDPPTTIIELKDRFVAQIEKEEKIR